MMRYEQITASDTPESSPAAEAAGLHRPRPVLSEREWQMLLLMSHGLSNKEMAAAARVSPETVKTHINNIFLKLRVRRRTHAVSLGFSLGLIGPVPPEG